MNQYTTSYNSCCLCMRSKRHVTCWMEAEGAENPVVDMPLSKDLCVKTGVDGDVFVTSPMSRNIMGRGLAYVMFSSSLEGF